jgi:hypothetical protein
MIANHEIRALVPDDFSFFGFDGLKRENKIKQRIRQVEIRCGTPGVSIVEDAVYVPESSRVARVPNAGRLSRVSWNLQPSRTNCTNMR